MKKNIYQLLLAVFILPGFTLFAQSPNQPQKATLVTQSEQVIEVPSIASRIASGTFMPAENIVKEYNPRRSGKNTSVPGKGMPKGPDPLTQKQMDVEKIAGKAPILTFEAAASGSTPTDPTGAVGPNHFVNAWNSSFRIWDKAGNPLTPAASLGNILPGTLGDPIVIYDRYADRFLITEFYSNGFYVGVSQGPDPVNDGWYVYTFPTDAFPDYPKFNLWSDGYYVTANKSQGSQTTSEVVFAMERDLMLTGNTSAQMVGFPLPGCAIDGFFSPLGFNCNGATLPPAGNAPIVYMQDDDWSSVSDDHLKIWNINVDWTTPANSTISTPQELVTADFDGLFDGGSFSNLEQPNGSQIDALQATVMYMAQYRRFATHNSVVFNFVVDHSHADDDAGIRWYELRQTNDGDPWTIYQEGTYIHPDGHSVFSGNMCMDANGNIALAYTMVSPTEFPSLRYTGRFAGDPLGTMTMTEEIILAGAQNDPSTRYGDYSQMTIDPVDDVTFWSIGEAFNGSTRKNHVGVFQFAPPELTAIFSADLTNTCPATPTTFTDASVGDPAPNSWTWTFTGGSPSSWSGQTPPAITYSAAGSYDVKLVVGNGVDTHETELIGYITINNVIADFSGTPTTVVVGNKVSFADNSSCSPTSWDWTFTGGTPGTYSGQTPPPIQYDVEGTYQVELTVTNGSGTDTRTIPSYITVVPPEFNMTNGTITICDGTFYDSGGPTGAYGNSENFIMTFYPGTPGDMIRFNFTEFDVENNYDYLHIYNGENTSAPLIGTYSGAVVPGLVTADNATGSLTFNFTSDGSVTPDGWTASISCYSTSSPPVADFSASNTAPIFNTDVIFTDLTMNAPTSWSWSFSPATAVYVNGTSASSQNPEVQFPNLGLYTVTLLATNAYGSDTETKIDYLNVTDISYCIPTFTTGTSVGDYISLVQLGDIDNATGALDAPYYEFYSAMSTDLEPGMMYTISLIAGTYATNNNISVWIDYNQNGLFDTAEKLGNATPGAIPDVATIDFTVPVDASTGITRMRVREVWNQTDIDPCAEYSYGETEDYTINIVGGIELDLRVYLEGPFNGSNMDTDLNSTLPLSQPFNTSPWNYGGTESIATIPTDAVEWVLVELRDAVSVGLATGGTVIDRQAGFIMNDGQIVDINENPILSFTSTVSNGLFVVVYQRNHIAVISEIALSTSGGIYTYDFSSGVNQAHGGTDGHKQLTSGIWGMFSGDGNADGSVNSTDKSPLWENQSGNEGYLESDFSLDGQSNNIDKDDYWEPNEGKNSQVPN